MLQNIPIFILGLGSVGSALLRQVLETQDVLAQRVGLRIVPVGLADSSGFAFNPYGFSDTTLQSALAKPGRGGLADAVACIRPLDEIEERLMPGIILVDVTASPQTVSTLSAALDRGCGVVLANKYPVAGPWAKAAAFYSNSCLRYEVTVGAGLPAINTLRYLLDTGDRAIAMEGCLSGTLGYLCAELERGVPYSVAVAEGRALGYTEPDPREDLSGRDVARKALILARTAGWPLEMSDLTVEALYPDEMAAMSTEAFLAASPALDEAYRRRVADARAQGMVLRYVARVSPERGTVGLVAVPKDGPLAALRGPANHIALTTVRYADVPMVVSGPGAGREVSAAGLLRDIVDLARKRGRELPAWTPKRDQEMMLPAWDCAG